MEKNIGKYRVRIPGGKARCGGMLMCVKVYGEERAGSLKYGKEPIFTFYTDDTSFLDEDAVTDILKHPDGSVFSMEARYVRRSGVFKARDF